MMTLEKLLPKKITQKRLETLIENNHWGKIHTDDTKVVASAGESGFMVVNYAIVTYVRKQNIFGKEILVQVGRVLVLDDLQKSIDLFHDISKRKLASKYSCI